ncbi:MAG: hypothetical protein DSY77_16120 [Bacteroidetes bacterium]|nr:MAG: hypothetical protein DSY77_16120 [Bacteroidota bacterium]
MYSIYLILFLIGAHIRWLLSGLNKRKLDYYVEETRQNGIINLTLAFTFLALIHVIILLVIKLFP